MIFTMPIIGVLYGIAAALFVLGIGAVPKRSVLNKDLQEEWLFTNGFQKLYHSVFGETDPIAICKTFGLEYDKYMFDCAIIGKVPNMEKEAMMRVVGVFSFILSIFVSVLLMNPIPIILGILLYFLMAASIPRQAHAQAENKKKRVSTELSRFVDLFLSALEINFPVEIAIIQTADALPCILSDELKTAMAETQVGAMNWQQALENIARKYEIDLLSDFVLDIITSYNKGVSVTEAVARKAYDIRQSALLSAKEQTAKMTNTILAPLMIFKIVPLLVIFMIPILIEIMSFFG